MTTNKAINKDWTIHEHEKSMKKFWISLEKVISHKQVMIKWWTSNEHGETAKSWANHEKSNEQVVNKSKLLSHLKDIEK